MPLTAFPTRYRPPYGPTPYISPGVLSPLEDDASPAFDPRMQSLDDNQPPSPLPPPPPEIPRPPQDHDTQDSAQLASMPPVNPDAGPKASYSGLKHMGPTMPPPGMEPAPAISEAPPEVAAAPPAPPIIPAQRPAQAADLGAKPPTDLEAATAANQKRLSDLHANRPEAPKSNWMQRVGQALLAASRFAPVANQIIHPKWSEQQRGYERQLSDAEREQKELETATSTGALAEQRAAQGEYRRSQALNTQERSDPHFGKQQLDPAYAKENVPWLMPDAQGQYWVDKSITGNLSKPERAEPKPLIVPPESTVVDSQGNVLYKGEHRADKPKTPTNEVEWAAIANDPNEKPERVAQARKVLADMATQKKSERPERQPTSTDEKRILNRALNDEFTKAGGDWNLVLENARSGKLSNPDFAAEIADHAEKMAKLPNEAQRKVAAADTTVDQVQRAIAAIDEAVKAHPELIGGVMEHPINALTRKTETVMGTEPADIGAVDSILETTAALQPGQHNFRSVGALGEFKKALGIDPRTGKPDGSRAWMINPEKAKAALQGVADFNQRLKDSTLKAAGRHPGSIQQNGANATNPASAPAVKTINMKAPNGVIKPVPADQVEHFKSRGAVVVP